MSLCNKIACDDGSGKTMSSCNGSEMFCIQANGTPESIYLWGKEAFPGCPEQQRAFQVLAAKFVLKYLSREDAGPCFETYQELERCRCLLQKMVGNTVTSDNLVMFLAGPAFGGKSAVVSEFLKYGKQYCSLIKESFNNETILVTAYPGDICASIERPSLCSTLFLGTTTRCIDARKKKQFQRNVKMIIIDEISAYNGSDMTGMNKRLQWFTDNTTAAFGGIDIVFVGNLCAMAPVYNKCFYKNFLSSINCYISLYKPRRKYMDRILHESRSPNVVDYTELRIMSDSSKKASREK